MKKWLSGFRGAILMTVLWAGIWALGFGGVMEGLVDPDGQIQDIWPMVLGIPGLIGGVLFSALLLIFEKGRSFDDVSAVRYAIWGAVTGFVLGILTIPAKIGDASPGALGMIAILTVLGVIASIASAVLIRLTARWQDPAPSARIADEKKTGN